MKFIRSVSFLRTVHVLLSDISRSQVETIVQIFAYVGVEPFVTFKVRRTELCLTMLRSGIFVWICLKSPENQTRLFLLFQTDIFAQNPDPRLARWRAVTMTTLHLSMQMWPFLFILLCNLPSHKKTKNEGGVKIVHFHFWITYSENCSEHDKNGELIKTAGVSGQLTIEEVVKLNTFHCMLMTG